MKPRAASLWKPWRVAPAGLHAPERLLLGSHEPEKPQPFQLTGTRLAFFAELPEVTDRVYALSKHMAIKDYEKLRQDRHPVVRLDLAAGRGDAAVRTVIEIELDSPSPRKHT